MLLAAIKLATSCYATGSATNTSRNTHIHIYRHILRYMYGRCGMPCYYDQQFNSYPLAWLGWAPVFTSATWTRLFSMCARFLFLFCYFISSGLGAKYISHVSHRPAHSFPFPVLRPKLQRREKGLSVPVSYTVYLYLLLLFPLLLLRVAGFLLQFSFVSHGLVNHALTSLEKF